MPQGQRGGRLLEALKDAVVGPPTPAQIAELAHSCPSGAITYERLDGGPEESAPKVNTVRVRENGPLAFRAPISIDGSDQGYRLTLCRCGHSGHKPYCDGSHRSAGFRSDP